MNTLVKILIPLYKEEMTAWERVAVDHNLRVFSSYPVCFLYPRGLHVAAYAQAYPQAVFLEVSPDWLGTRRGIQGYNEMMMSKDFYGLFADTEYVLVCHTDAWIFRDELAGWCAKGYDLLAAPWPVRPRYLHFPLKQFVWLKRVMGEVGGGISRVRMYGRVGNGGLCLRKVSACASACERYADVIADFNRHADGMHNEDIFWALVPEDFRYPDVETALSFAFDLKPRLCYELNHGRLPMGCHGFMHKSRMGFWAEYIPCVKSSMDK